jgi:hypothetical protein
MNSPLRPPIYLDQKASAPLEVFHKVSGVWFKCVVFARCLLAESRRPHHATS